MAEIIWENIIEEQEDPSEVEAVEEFFEIKNSVPIEQVYLHQKPGFVDIGNGILKYDDLLNSQDYTYLLFQCDSLDEESWIGHGIPETSELYARISTPLTVQPLNAAIVEAIINEYWTNEHNTVNRTRPGDDVSRMWGGKDSWKSADYIALYYLGEWTGGDIKVLSDNSKIELKPNTLYCFPIDKGQAYLSDEVLSGVKYSFVDWIYKHGDWVVG